MNGVPPMVVAKNLGHANMRMVEKHYGHLAPYYIADAIRADTRGLGSSRATSSRCEARDERKGQCPDMSEADAMEYARGRNTRSSA